MKQIAHWINKQLDKVTTLIVGQDEHTPLPVQGSNLSQPMRMNATPLPTQPANGKASVTTSPTQKPPTANPVPAQQKHVVGLKVRKKGDQVEAGQLVQHKPNDTAYGERNEIVQMVYDRYAKFGDTVASSILGKTFLPNGQQIMLERLGIESVGSAMPDHDQIVDWIDENGVEQLCEKLHIRLSEPKSDSTMAQHKRNREVRNDQKATVTQAGISPVKLTRDSNKQ